jgi:hypothetical protein
MKYEIKLNYKLRDSQHLKKIHLGKKIRPLLEKLRLQPTSDEGWSGQTSNLAEATAIVSEILHLLAGPPKNTAGELKCLTLDIRAQGQVSPSRHKSEIPETPNRTA